MDARRGRLGDADRRRCDYQTPIDPHHRPERSHPMSPPAGQPPKRWALKGRIVTMVAKNDVVSGTIYVEDNRIKAIVKTGQPAPAGFETVVPLDSHGTIYPGLIELHNHLSYDVLPLWQVPKAYDNRGQWQDAAEYKNKVSGPMAAIAMGDDGALLPALVRYVESKCLIAGTTTSQGITLQKWSSEIRKYYKGVLRTAEIGHKPDLALAHSHVADVQAQDWESFDKIIKKAAENKSCVLLHLSEGVDDPARKNFLALRNAEGKWAIERSLAGIHCTALKPEDFAIMAEHQAAMVWSPLSNLLLYTKTGDVKAARNAGVLVALGSDWSPSGSKNLLGELKVARLVSDLNGIGLDDFDVVALATRNPAQILQWSKGVGTLESGKYADFVVVSGTTGDPYRHLIEAREDNVALVVIDGRPRCGLALVMQELGVAGEAITVAGAPRVIDFDTPDDRARPAWPAAGTRPDDHAGTRHQPTHSPSGLAARPRRAIPQSRGAAAAPRIRGCPDRSRSRDRAGRGRAAASDQARPAHGPGRPRLPPDLAAGAQPACRVRRQNCAVLRLSTATPSARRYSARRDQPMRTIMTLMVACIACSEAAAQPCTFDESTAKDATSGTITLPWRTDYPSSTGPDPHPWSAIDFKAQWREYLAAVLSTIKSAGFRIENSKIAMNPGHRWWIAHWMDYGPAGRESMNGLTKERAPHAGDLSQGSPSGAQLWAIGWYNSWGAIRLRTVFANKCNPQMSNGQV